MNPIARGRIVRSKAGRDEGRLFMVVSVLDDQYVEIADGALRKLVKPKKKKIRHLEITPYACETLKARMDEGVQVVDAEIRNGIQAQTQQDK